MGGGSVLRVESPLEEVIKLISCPPPNNELLTHEHQVTEVCLS